MYVSKAESRLAFLRRVSLIWFMKSVTSLGGIFNLSEISFGENGLHSHVNNSNRDIFSSELLVSASTVFNFSRLSISMALVVEP